MIEASKSRSGSVAGDFEFYAARRDFMRDQGITRASLVLKDLEDGFGTLIHLLSLPIQIFTESFQGAATRITQRREERLIRVVDRSWHRLQSRVSEDKRGVLKVAKDCLKECKTQRQIRRFKFSPEQLESLGTDCLERLRRVAQDNLKIRRAEKIERLKLTVRVVASTALLTLGLAAYWTYLAPIAAIMAVVNLANAASVAATRGRRLDGMIVTDMTKQRLRAALNAAKGQESQDSQSSDVQSSARSSNEHSFERP